LHQMLEILWEAIAQVFAIETCSIFSNGNHFDRIA